MTRENVLYNVEESVEHLITDILKPFASNRVTYQLITDSEQTGGGIILSLTPTQPESAPIVVHVDNNSNVVDMVCGKGTRFEIFYGENRPERELLKEIRDYCYAIINGNFGETIWTRNGKLVKAEGKFTFSEASLKPHRVSYYDGITFFSPFSIKEKCYYKYAPW